MYTATRPQNTNYATMTEYKLSEAKVLNHYGSGWEATFNGGVATRGCCGG